MINPETREMEKSADYTAPNQPELIGWAIGRTSGESAAHKLLARYRELLTCKRDPTPRRNLRNLRILNLSFINLRTDAL